MLINKLVNTTLTIHNLYEQRTWRAIYQLILWDDDKNKI